MKKSSSIAFAAVCFILIFPFIFSLTYTWTKIQCKKQYIDINSGMLRTQRYYWFLKYSDKIETSFLSDLLGTNSAENPQWQIFNTLSFGRSYSPHYSFHHAAAQITHLKLMLSLYNIDEDDSKAIARQIIKLWKEGRSDRKADEYLREISVQYAKDHNIME